MWWLVSGTCEDRTCGCVGVIVIPVVPTVRVVSIATQPARAAAEARGTSNSRWMLMLMSRRRWSPLVSQEVGHHLVEALRREIESESEEASCESEAWPRHWRWATTTTTMRWRMAHLAPGDRDDISATLAILGGSLMASMMWRWRWMWMVLASGWRRWMAIEDTADGDRRHSTAAE